MTSTIKELLKWTLTDGWLEVADIRENHYPKFGDKLPKELTVFLDQLEANLKAAK